MRWGIARYAQVGHARRAARRRGTRCAPCVQWSEQAVEVGEDGEDLMELLSAQRMNLLHHLLMEYYFEVGGRITQLL